MASKTILVADSNLRYRTLIATSLELMFGVVKIIKAATLDEALEKIKRYNPNITLIDAEMLQNCSEEVTRILRRQHYTSTVILLTDSNKGASINESLISFVDNVVTRQMLMQQLNLVPPDESIYLEEYPATTFYNRRLKI